MKSDIEIKQWIDGRDVLTERELCQYVYGYWDNRLYKFLEWWKYVLETKDPVKLRQYKSDKINHSKSVREKMDKIKTIWDKDERFKQVGFKAGSKLLKNIYGIDIPASTFRNYYKVLCSNSQMTA